MNESQIQTLINAAQKAVDSVGDSANHTVGAAAMTKDGEIISGVNMYHFNGGPDAEMVVMSMAISQGKKDLVAIAAVGDRNRGVLPVCGRCRQTIFDYYPEMQVVVRDETGHKTVPISDLLPYGFDWNKEQA